MKFLHVRKVVITIILVVILLLIVLKIKGLVMVLWGGPHLLAQVLNVMVLNYVALIQTI